MTTLLALLVLGAIPAVRLPDVVPVVAHVQPAVVQLDVEMLRDLPGRSDEPFALKGIEALGSGFFFTAEGHILTCNHVIADYERITVVTADGRRFGPDKVHVIGRDPYTDLAVLRVSADDKLPFVELADSDRLAVGQWVVAVGTPLGLEGSATIGLVSGLGRWGQSKSSGPDFQDFIQTDALINPGNSGGPLVDLAGRVVGVNSFGKTARGALTGIGFAIPANLVRSIADQLVANRLVVRGYAGINTQPLTDAIRRSLGLEKLSGGIMVAATVKDGPADLAGVRAGDVLTTLNGKAIADVRWFQDELSGRLPGTTVAFGVNRQGQDFGFEIKLTAWPVAGVEPRVAPAPEHWLGLIVGPLEDKDRARSGVSRGVVVQAFEPGSPADRANITAGDVIVEVNYAALRDVAGFGRVAKAAAGYGRPMLFRLMRGRSPFYVAIEP